MPRVITHYLQREMAIPGLIGATIFFAAFWTIQILAVDTGVWATLSLFLVMTLAGCLATMAVGQLIPGYAAGSTRLARRILIIGEPDTALLFKEHLQSRRGQAFVPVVLQIPEIGGTLARKHGIWGVVVVGETPSAPTMAALLDCKFRGLRVFSEAAFREGFLGRIDLNTLTANDLLNGPGFVSRRPGAIVKRATDIVLAVAMLTVTLPLMLLTALAIKADTPGPVLDRRQCLGRFNRTFTLYTFRSMTADAEVGGDRQWPARKVSHLTRVGRVIRATGIDKLPRLANVISGEMSLVGPRPERPHFVNQLAGVIPFYRQRTYVKPGLTGWAQINFPYGAPADDAREKFAYDLYYIKYRSMIMDGIILLSTIRVLLFRESAR